MSNKEIQKQLLESVKSLINSGDYFVQMADFEELDVEGEAHRVTVVLLKK